jgi:hypothetical protein
LPASRRGEVSSLRRKLDRPPSWTARKRDPLQTFAPRRARKSRNGFREFEPAFDAAAVASLDRAAGSVYRLSAR